MTYQSDMSGRPVLVTGAARGIGLAIAHAFGARGARVAINDRDPADVDRAVAALREKGSDAIAVPGDISDEHACAGIVGEACDGEGRLAVLVNNAAIGRAAPLASHKIDYWRKVLDVNLMGPFLLARAAQEALRQADGAIVNIASAAAYGMKDQCSYNASKGGLISLTRSLALELGPAGVRVNSVCPGFVDTEMLKSDASLHRHSQKFARSLPLGRFARPEEIAEAVLWLGSDDASYVTGHALFVDGGWIRP